MISMLAVKAAAVAGTMVGATLVAAPQASADFVLDPPLSPYAAFYQGPTGELSGYASNYGLINNNVALAPGTSPSAAPTAASFQMVWHGANGDLWSSGPNGPVDTGLAMAPGTSPSLLTFPDGNWIALVVDAGGELQSTGSWGTSAPLGPSTAVAPGTSPSLAAVPVPDGPRGSGPDDFDYAWQGTNHDLWLFTGGLPFDSGNAMAPGTSPSMYSYPDITDGYIAAFQAGDGDLGWSSNIYGDGKFGTTLAMAPGTSPSVVDPVSGGDIPTIAVQGSNGDLWTYGSLTRGTDPAGYDTGLPMMAGTNPSMIVTPYDAPGAPLGALTYYIGYASSTGVVSLYGLSPQGPASSDIELSSGQSLAPGTSPSIVSSLNWVDGEQVVFDGETGANWQTTLAPAAADTATVPLKLPSKPTIKPDTAPLAASGDCATVRANLKQYAAQNIKQVTCETTTPPTTPTPAHATKPAATSSATVSGSCSYGQWTIERTEECVQNAPWYVVTLNTETGAITGSLTFTISQDINLSTSSGLFTENDTITYASVVGPATGLPADMTFTAGCSSPCRLATTPSFVFPLTLGAAKSFSFTYQDSPGAQTPDFFGTNYVLDVTIPGFVKIGGPGTWNAPAQMRCDNNTPNWTSPGCVVPSYVPTLVLPLSVFGAAAMNAYVGELYLPGTPGLSDATPLTRGNPANSDPNRAVTCAGFNAFPAGNIYGVTSDSCDEYPFASSQQSGGALGIAGSSCLEIVSAQGTNGSWTFSMLNRYSAVYPQVCLRGHVNSTLNSSVGSLELNPLYINDRMMIGDPYTVQVTS